MNTPQSKDTFSESSTIDYNDVINNNRADNLAKLYCLNNNYDYSTNNKDDFDKCIVPTHYDIKCDKQCIPINLNIELDNIPGNIECHKICNSLNNLYNDNGRVISYLVGGVCRDILLNRISKINDFDIVVFNITIDELHNWLVNNNYNFDNKICLIENGIFELTDYKIDIMIGNQLDNNIFKHHYASSLRDNLNSRDSLINSVIIDYRDKTMYDTCEGNIIKNINNSIITTNITNLNYVYRFRSSFFFRCLLYSITLGSKWSIDSNIWNGIKNISSNKVEKLSNSWSFKFINRFNDDQFIQFMQILETNSYLQKFIRKQVYSDWKTKYMKIKEKLRYNTRTYKKYKNYHDNKNIAPIKFDEVEFPKLGMVVIKKRDLIKNN